MNIINAVNVNKSYSGKKVLNNFSVSIQEGSVFALLGPNGAGKTTFVKSLLGLVKIDSGEINMNGVVAPHESSRESVGYLPEKYSFYPYYTVQGAVEFYGKMQGLSGAELTTQVDYALGKLNISDLRKQKISTLSKGQTQRVGLASLLMGDNNVFILDEPFSGLDPIGIKELKELIKYLSEKGKTIFINSHILSEMEQICDQMALLNKGECLAQGNIKELIGDQSLEDFFYEKIKSMDNGL